MTTWLKAALIRAVKTIAQTAVGMITVGAAMNEVQWLYVGSVSLTAGILSILTSLAGLPEVELSYTVQELYNEKLEEIEYDDEAH